MRNRRLRRSIAAATGLMLGAAMLATPAAAPGSVITKFQAQRDALAAPQLGPGWYGYPEKYRLVDARVKVLKGEKLGHLVCQFDIVTHANRRAPTQEARVRAVNHAECKELVEVGRLPRDEERQALSGAEPAAASPGDEAETEETPTADTDYEPGDIWTPGAGAGADPAADFDIIACDPECALAPGQDATDAVQEPRYGSGYIESRFEDPVNADVNRVHTSVSWSWTLYVTGGSGSDFNWWLSETGWGLRKTNLRHGVRDRTVASGVYAYASTYSHFGNYWFCKVITQNPFQPTTRSYYDRNVVRGYAGGSVKGNVRHMSRGGCHKLLHFKTRTVKSY